MSTLSDVKAQVGMFDRWSRHVQRMTGETPVSKDEEYSSICELVVIGDFAKGNDYCPVVLIG